MGSVGSTPSQAARVRTIAWLLAATASLGCGLQDLVAEQLAKRSVPAAPTFAYERGALGPELCPYPARDLDRARAAQTDQDRLTPDLGFAFDARGRVGSEPIYCETLGRVSVPSGKLVSFDPNADWDPRPLPVEVPPGDYPVYVSRRERPGPLGLDPPVQGAAAFTVIVFDDVRPTRWEAMPPKLTVDDIARAWPQPGCCAVVADVDAAQTMRSRWRSERDWAASPNDWQLAVVDRTPQIGSALVQHRRGGHAFGYAGYTADGRLTALAFHLGVFDFLLPTVDRQVDPVPQGPGECAPAELSARESVPCPFDPPAVDHPLRQRFSRDHRCTRLGELVVTSGRIAVADPLTTEDAPAIAAKVPRGRHPLWLQRDAPEGRVNAAVVVVGKGVPTRWERAGSYGVDTGFSGFFDVEAGNAMLQMANEIAAGELDAAVHDKLRPAIGAQDLCLELVPQTGANVLLFTSGLGDGIYDTWLGYAGDGALLAIATDFTGESMSPSEAPPSHEAG